VIGTWRLICAPGPSEGCLLRHRDADLRLGPYRIAVEVRSVSGVLVPVVAVHGVPAQKVVGSVLGIVIGLRLDGGNWLELPCAPTLLCTPTAELAPALATAFPGAASMRLRLQVTLPNGDTLPRPEHAFDLRATSAALGRLTSGGVIATASPAPSASDWMGMLRALVGRR
jgi:hypothetical protein